MTRDPILSVQGLSMRFGGIRALHEVCFSVQRHSITALIGPNGAGKTTVFNCLTGFYPTAVGCIQLHTRQGITDVGQVVGAPWRWSVCGDWQGFKVHCFYHWFGGTHWVNRAGLARTFQNIRLFRDMTVVENLLVAQHQRVNQNVLAGLFNTSAFQKAEQAALERAFYWLDFLDLSDTANALAGSLAYGQQRRLEIARALCTSPELLCLDEPAAGLNPSETEALSEVLEQLRTQHGLTILLIEHDMGLVMKRADRIVVLEQGEVIAEGAPLAVAQNPRVVAAYLGTEED